MCSKGCCTGCLHVVFYLTLSYWLSIAVTYVHFFYTSDVHRWKCAERPGYVANNSGIKVLLVSQGQTGSTSMVYACEELGLRAYHLEDIVTFAWEAAWENATVESWSRAMWNCRVECLSTEPMMFPHVAIPGSPDAKLVYAVRDFEEWKASSALAGLRDLIFVMQSRWLFSSPIAVPWYFLFDLLTGLPSKRLQSGSPVTHGPDVDLVGHTVYQLYGRTRLLTTDVNYHFRGSWAQATRPPLDGQNPNEWFYYGVKKNISKYGPGRKVHEFNIKTEGYKEFAEIVGRPVPPGKSKLPQVRSKDSWSNDGMTIDQPRERYLQILLCVVCHIINWFIYKWVFNMLRSLLCCCCAKAKEPTGPKKSN